MNNNYSLGIIGGMGPLASAYFYELITLRENVYKDQEHIKMIILSDTDMPDRTSYILGRSSDSPLPKLIEDARLLENLGVSLIAIPCNTSTYFYDELSKSVNVRILNLVDDTIEYLIKKGIKKVRILATEGTIESSIYQNKLKENKIEYVLTNDQKDITRIIYDRVKANISLDENDISVLNNSINEVEAVILGCTELSILKRDLKLDDRYIDPLEIEADKIISILKK